MITPNKFVSFKDSSLSQIVYILDELNEPMELLKLYAACRRHFNGPSEFVYAMDALHVLGALTFELNTQVVRRAG